MALLLADATLAKVPLTVLSFVIRRREGAPRLPPGLARPPGPRPQPVAPQPATSAVAKPSADQATPRLVMRQKPSRYGNRPSIFGPLTTTTIAGQPLALWILLGVGLLTVIVLAAIIFVRASG